jgi:LCP family protein required for cell wall assembly
MFARAPRATLARVLILIAVAIVVLIVVVVACTRAAAPPASATATPVATGTPSPTGSPSPTPKRTPTPKATPNPFNGRRMTLLILGSDSTPSRVAQGLGKLTDSIIVLSVNAAHNQVSMISFPRDIVDIPLGNGGTWRTKINAIPYFLGEQAMKRAIATTLQQPIDYYVEVSMLDFAAMVNAIGGVDIQVRSTIIDPSIQLSVRAGLRHMDGTLALKYARSRHTTSDWDRAARQQQLVAAVVRKMVNPNTKINFLDMLAALKSLQTDLPLDKFSALFELARASARAHVVTAVLAPPRFSSFAGLELGTGRGYIEEPNVAAMRAYASSVMGH